MSEAFDVPGLIVIPEDPRCEAATSLLDALCAELSERYRRPPSPFSVEEALAPRATLVVARLNGEPVSCGALRCIDAATVEIKRMYVVPTARRLGIAKRVLAELERCAAGFGHKRIILETGVFQPEAIALYYAVGYTRTEAYGRYVGNPDARCFGKDV